MDQRTDGANRRRARSRHGSADRGACANSIPQRARKAGRTLSRQRASPGHRHAPNASRAATDAAPWRARRPRPRSTTQGCATRAPASHQGASIDPSIEVSSSAHAQADLQITSAHAQAARTHTQRPLVRQQVHIVHRAATEATPRRSTTTPPPAAPPKPSKEVHRRGRGSGDGGACASLSAPSAHA